MVRFKGCPRCQGDMLIENDTSGEYRHCLQCGFVEEAFPVLTGIGFPERRVKKAA